METVHLEKILPIMEESEQAIMWDHYENKPLDWAIDFLAGIQEDCERKHESARTDWFHRRPTVFHCIWTGIYNIASCIVGNLKIGNFFSFGAPTLPKLRFVQPSQLMNTVQGNSGEHLSQQRIPSLPPLIAERISARQLLRVVFSRYTYVSVTLKNVN